MMTSSSLLKNSGLKAPFSSCMTADWASCEMLPSGMMPSSRYWLPRLLVRMMMVFLKSTVRP